MRNHLFATGVLALALSLPTASIAHADQGGPSVVQPLCSSGVGTLSITPNSQTTTNPVRIHGHWSCGTASGLTHVWVDVIWGDGSPQQEYYCNVNCSSGDFDMAHNYPPPPCGRSANYTINGSVKNSDDNITYNYHDLATVTVKGC